MEDLNTQPFEGFEPSSKDGKQIVPMFASFFQSWQLNLLEQFEKMQQEFEKLCITNSTKVHKLEGKVRTLEKKLEKVELQSDDQAAAELQVTVTLGGNALPSVSVNEKYDQVATEVIKTKLNISLPNNVIVAAYRLGKKDNEQTRDNRKIIVRFTNKQKMMT